MPKVWGAIRRNDDGSVDDVAITSDLFRLEQMDDDQWWACAYRGDEAVHFRLYWDKKRRRIVCQSYGDTIGCIDDTEKQDA